MKHIQFQPWGVHAFCISRYRLDEKKTVHCFEDGLFCLYTIISV